jgi:hypothetical protein
MKKQITPLARALFLLLVMLVFVQANAQKRYAPLALADIRYTIENDVMVSPNEMQFDLFLLDTDWSDPFELSIIQAGILVNGAFLNGGTCTPSIVAGYSDLVASQQPTTTQWSTGTYGGCIKMTPRAGPGAGNGTIILPLGMGSRVARIKLVNSVPFPCGIVPNLTFNFTTSPYPTKVFAYFAGMSTQVTTNSTNCFQGETYLPNICVKTWSGLVDTYWYNPYNWVGEEVPPPTGDVVIPAGCPHYPVIMPSDAVVCNKMDIQGNGTKSPLSNTFTISGMLVINGTMTITATGALNVGAGGALTINGDLHINGSMKVESQGSLITNGAVTGNATIERYVAANLNWHLISSPVSGQSICNGVFAPILANFPGNIMTWDFYNWLPNCGPSILHWRNLRNADGTVNTVDFPLLAFADSRGYLAAYGNGWATTKQFVGPPNTNTRVLAFYDVIDECSWVLPGNPYPSAVDWNLVTGKENLSSAYYYIWNENKLGGAGYEFWADATHFSSAAVDGNIPSMQGFFIKVNPFGSKNLTIPNSARVHDNLVDHWLKSDQTNRLTLQLGNATNYDEAYIQFESTASTGIDRMDAEKLFTMTATVPQVYTIVDNSLKAALNDMSYINNGTTIPVGFVAPEEGQYSITVKGIESFGSLAGLSLEDLQLNYTQNLLNNPTYTFTAAANEDAGRFLLHFAGSIGMNDKNNSTISIYSSEKTVYITCATGFKNATVTISNLLGQEIVSRKLSDQKMSQVKVSALQGYYLVKVQDENSVKTAKVYIN